MKRDKNATNSTTQFNHEYDPKQDDLFLKVHPIL